MKILIILLLLFNFSFGQKKQLYRKINDSVALQSRKQADKILSNFDSIKTSKLLFSIENQYYYIILKDKRFKEIYIHTDKLGNIIQKRFITNSQRDSLDLIKIQPFELNKYKKKLITSIANTTYVAGNPSYFVIKNKKGQRFGEYSLPLLNFPLPIDERLHAYLIKNLAEERSVNP